MIDINKNSELITSIEREQTLEEFIRELVRGGIEKMVCEEIDIAFGSGRYERGESRLGYRNGTRERSITTTSGLHTVNMPRGAYFEPGPDGKKEWNSKLIPPYARRTEEVEQAIIATYLCGVNTRKVRRALASLLKGAALSKSTVSRVLASLSEHFDAWKCRDLSNEDIAILYLDGFHLKIRIGKKVQSVPVLCAIGVRPDGSKILLSLDVRTSESAAAWGAFTEDLAARGVTKPVLTVIDGNKGLHSAVKTAWPWIDVQRCTKHKLENISTHAPKAHYEEIKADYHSIVYADSEAKAQAAWKRFEGKWGKQCPAVVKSLQEGGDELLTFMQYPATTWKSLRTTNIIERLNGEFRRRVKTQGSLPNTEASLKLLFGLFASGHIKMNNIFGCNDIGEAIFKKRLQLGLINSQLAKAA